MEKKDKSYSLFSGVTTCDKMSPAFFTHDDDIKILQTITPHHKSKKGTDIIVLTRVSFTSRLLRDLMYLWVTHMHKKLNSVKNFESVGKIMSKLPKKEMEHLRVVAKETGEVDSEGKFLGVKFEDLLVEPPSFVATLFSFSSERIRWYSERVRDGVLHDWEFFIREKSSYYETLKNFSKSYDSRFGEEFLPNSIMMHAKTIYFYIMCDPAEPSVIGFFVSTTPFDEYDTVITSAGNKMTVLKKRECKTVMDGVLFKKASSYLSEKNDDFGKTQKYIDSGKVYHDLMKSMKRICEDFSVKGKETEKICRQTVREAASLVFDAGIMQLAMIGRFNPSDDPVGTKENKAAPKENCDENIFAESISDYKGKDFVVLAVRDKKDSALSLHLTDGNVDDFDGTVVGKRLFFSDKRADIFIRCIRWYINNESEDINKIVDDITQTLDTNCSKESIVKLINSEALSFIAETRVN